MDEREKRKLARFELEIPAKIEVLAEGRKEEEEGLSLLTSDISSGGAFFHTSQPLPEGTDVKIDLVLPLDRLKELKEDCDHVYIKITGTVLRSESDGMAIYFNDDYHFIPKKGENINQH